jgi:hypothetical protein
MFVCPEGTLSIMNKIRDTVRTRYFYRIPGEVHVCSINHPPAISSSFPGDKPRPMAEKNLESRCILTGNRHPDDFSLPYGRHIHTNPFTVCFRGKEEAGIADRPLAG